MRYKLLGSSGLRVSELALGTMAFGEDWGWGADRDECGRILDAYREAGGNFLDTADKYTDGSSERHLGQLLEPYRDEVVLATKYSLSRNPADPNASGNHRKNLVRALDASLKRLRTDYVDVLWVHIWDFLTPIEEVMRALDDQIRAGKVLYLGVSDAPAWIIARANTLAEYRGWTPFIAAQAQYSLLERSIERDLLPMSSALDLAVTAWSPLGMGVLTGKYSNGAAADDARLHVQGMDGQLSDRNLAIAGVVADLAAETGATSAQIALAWLCGRPGVVIPIVGARRESQLRDNLGALEVELTPDQLDRLDAISAVELGFPNEFLARQRTSSFVFGDTVDRIDNHRIDRSGLPLTTRVPILDTAR